MPKRRVISLIAAILAAGGSLVFTGAYAVHLRSDTYRKSVEQDLTAFFRLPCEIAHVRGRTFSSREFRDVAIYLPDRRDRVFSCKSAVWHEIPSPADEVHHLDLTNGIFLLGSDRWLRDDYKTIFVSGLGHDFSELNLARVGISDFEFGFNRGDFALRCRKADGEVDLEDDDEGVARLQAYELNGIPIPEGVGIRARFKVKNGVDVREVTLSLPEVPLASVGLDGILNGPITRGHFAGMVRYVSPDREHPSEIWVSGSLRDAALEELTRRLAIGPFVGDVSVNVESARLDGTVVTHLKGRGSIRDLSFSSFAPLLGVPKLSGSASMTFEPVDVSLGRINRLRIEGRVIDVALEEILQIVGRGSATGRVTVHVNNLEIVENAIKSADLEVFADPPRGAAGTIDRTLLLGAAEKILNFSWPESIPESFLPEKLEYVRFGARLLIRDNQLRILGTHGASNDVILTVRVFGQSFGLIKEQSGTIDLTPWVDQFLGRLREYDPERVREWWRTHGRASES